MKEDAYRRLTYDLMISVAGALAKLEPTMTFVDVSGVIIRFDSSAVSSKHDWNSARSRFKLEVLNGDALNCAILPTKRGAGDSA